MILAIKVLYLILNIRCAKIKTNDTEILTVFYYGTIEGLYVNFVPI